MKADFIPKASSIVPHKDSIETYKRASEFIESSVIPRLTALEVAKSIVVDSQLDFAAQDMAVKMLKSRGYDVTQNGYIFIISIRKPVYVKLWRILMNFVPNHPVLSAALLISSIGFAVHPAIGLVLIVATFICSVLEYTT